jgi:hypothetical protein
VKEGIGLSVAQALSALLSKYLDCVVAVEQGELESLFSNFVPRSKMKDAVNALLAAREFSFVHVSGRSMLQVTPEKMAFVAAVVPTERLPARNMTREKPRGHFTKPVSKQGRYGRPAPKGAR